MKYVALDIGNVLVHADFNNFINLLSETLNITTEEANYFMNRTQKLHDLGLTRMEDELRDHFKIKSQVTMGKLIGAWNSIIISDASMVSMITNMIEKHNLKVALLSNVGLEHAKQMERVLNYDGFLQNSTKHFSCVVGARKPNVIYYHTFLELHPEWRGCPYIDDLQENLDMGSQFGFKPFKFSLEDEVKSGNYSKYPGGTAPILQEIEKFILDNQQA